MKSYCVQIIEVYRQDMIVNADSAEHARSLVAKDVYGEVTEGDLHYDYTLEPDEWKVFEIK